MRARLGDRPYTGSNRLETHLPSGAHEPWQPWIRHDQRLLVGSGLIIRATRYLEITVRHDFLANRSNVNAADADACLQSANPCHPQDYANRSFVKHQISAELGVIWP